LINYPVSDQPVDSTPQDSGSPDPYGRLGVEADASFDAVQAARQARLEEVGDDAIARSRVEAAYDAVLMERLKERQQGRVSSAARTASQREQAPQPSVRPALPSRPPLPQLPGARLPVAAPSLPRLALASGPLLWFPLVADGILAVLLLVVPTAPPELLLALATGVTLTTLQRRNGRFLQAVGWSFALLSLGLLLGSVLAGLVGASLSLPTLTLQSLPALLLLLIGALLIG
jgi:hypothetical protein